MQTCRCTYTSGCLFQADYCVLDKWRISLPGLAKAGVSPHESVISVSHTVNTHSEQHRGLPGKYFSIKPFQKSVPRQDYTDSFLQGKKKRTFFNISTVLGQDVPQTPLFLIWHLFLPFWKLFSSFKAHLLAGWMENKQQQGLDAWQLWKSLAKLRHSTMNINCPNPLPNTYFMLPDVTQS